MNIKQVNRLIVTLALATVALVALTLALSSQSARAQAGDEIHVDKQLGRADPVVHVVDQERYGVHRHYFAPVRHLQR